MPTLVNLTFDVADLIGADFDARRTKVWVETNIPSGSVIDTTGKVVRLGDVKATVGTDGKGTFTGLFATNSADLNPTGFLYQVYVDYATRADGRKLWSSGWFPMTASSDLALVSPVVGGPVNSTDDAVIASRINDPASQTRAAANQVYVTKSLPSFGSAASQPRIPFTSAQTHTPADGPTTTDFVTHGMSAVFTGDYTGMVATNPGWAWGANIFTTTGTGVADGKGITNLFGATIEAAIRSGSGASLTEVVGLNAEAAFMGGPSAATVTRMISLKSTGPKRKDGATAGTATEAYGVWVDAVSAAAVGATIAYSLWVDGGTTRLKGVVNADEVQITSKVRGTAGTLPLFGGADATLGAALTLQQNDTGGGNIRAQFSGPSAGILFSDGTDKALITGAGYGRFGGVTELGAQLSVVSNAANRYGLIVRLAGAPTVDGLRVENSTGAYLFRVANNGVTQAPGYLTSNSYVIVGEESSGGSVTLRKMTAAAANPGASSAAIYLRDGTTAGTLKLVVRAGAAGAETTILDNITQ